MGQVIPVNLPDHFGLSSQTNTYIFQAPDGDLLPFPQWGTPGGGGMSRDKTGAGWWQG